MLVFPCKLETFFKQLRAKILSEKIYAHLIGKLAVLNIGCGKGFLENELIKVNEKLQFTGVDVEPSNNYTGKFIIGEFEELNFQNETFDVVIASLSLHHLVSPALALQKIHSILRKDGILIVLEIAPQSMFLKKCLFDSRILCFTRRHTWTSDEFSILVKNAGFTITDTKSVPIQGVIYYAKK